MPPCWAKAIASAASVTVSMAAEQSGICKRMFRVNCVAVSVSYGRTSDLFGTSNTSSNVKPSIISEVIICSKTPQDDLGSVAEYSMNKSGRVACPRWPTHLLQGRNWGRPAGASHPSRLVHFKFHHSYQKQNCPPFQRAVDSGGAHFRTLHRRNTETQLRELTYCKTAS